MPEQKLYIGNLPYCTTEHDIREYFSGYGPIYSVMLIYDTYTRRACGYGFVELDEAAAKTVLRELNNAEFLGRRLKVRKAIEKEAAKKVKEYPPRDERCPGCGGNPGGNFGEYGDFTREDFRGLRVNDKYCRIERGSYGLYHAYKFRGSQMEYSGPSNKSPVM